MLVVFFPNIEKSYKYENGKNALHLIIGLAGGPGEIIYTYITVYSIDTYHMYVLVYNIHACIVGVCIYTKKERFQRML